MNVFYHINTFLKDIQTALGIVAKNMKDKAARIEKNSYKPDTATEQAPQRWNTATTDGECKQWPSKKDKNGGGSNSKHSALCTNPAVPRSL